MTREELIELRDDPTTPEGMRTQVIRELDIMNEKNTPAPAAKPKIDIDIVDMVAALEKFEQELKTESAPPVEVEKPKVLGTLTESQQFAADQKHRGPEPVEGEPEPKPRGPYVWRNQFGETDEQIKARIFREKQRASAEWAQAMGVPMRPEWPGV